LCIKIRILIENRVLRGIFRPKEGEVTPCWRKNLHEGFSSLYSSPDIIRIKSRSMRWKGLVTRMAPMRSDYKLVVGKPEWKRPFGR
jgi:hypothetical protein